MGAPGRVELPTNGLGNRCSIHLSYGATLGMGIDFSLLQLRLRGPTQSRLIGVVSNQPLGSVEISWIKAEHRGAVHSVLFDH